MNSEKIEAAIGGDTAEEEITTLTCVKCGDQEIVGMDAYENSVGGWEIVTKEPETWQHDYDCAGSVEYNLADLPQRDNAMFAQRLKSAFPWLGTEEDAGSGADVIDVLGSLYNAVRLKPDTQRRIAEDIKKHCQPPAELVCPKCGKSDDKIALRVREDTIVDRDVVSYKKGRLKVQAMTNYSNEEGEHGARLECAPCGFEFPIPAGVEVDYV